MADTTLSTLEPEAAVYREHDGQGLYFRVKPTGQKLWELRYTKPGTKARSWLGLGPYPSVSGAQARAKAQEARALLAQGIDPATQRKAEEAQEKAKAENTFEPLAREWYAARVSGWGKSYAKRVMGALELHVFPKMGKRSYIDITPMEWMELFRRMEKQGILEQMANVRRYCKEIYDLARVTGRAVNNPVDGLEKFLQKQKSENYAHVDQAELPKLLQAVTSYSNRMVRIGLRLLIINGLRPSEVREAKWEEFDLEKGIWEIPAERMKKRREHIVPLSTQSLNLLKELKIYSGAYDRLFPGRNDRTKPLSNMVFNMALRRMGYKGEQTGHGFRHIASTILNEHGFDENHIEAQLSHAKAGVAGVYNKAKYLEQRRTMMQWYADHLDALERGNVVSLPKRA
ncbi:integrase [Pseudomonas sp. PA15(2017)]|uniref:tyrosine-type recombinase/integrase n=1 Tax=Pseudomonas sp. PA15(2017) TaxID=1932111 RepID=UPI00095BEA62|nr:tyrosine-type recombinase/integrase [Pseudomonas sp. PA15(2017)]OLU22892.1 integrase [Pseudomonas sp. PA15(2017)]